jgi:hydrogenase maturation protease
MKEWELNLLEDKPVLDSLAVRGGEVKRGDYVWLRPRPGGDVLDMALTGHMAAVEAFEQDFDGQIQVAVVVDADPGKDLGLLRQPGHRFFFKPEEIVRAPRVLIAGIGNVFFGDDAFGVEVVRRLASTALPGNVRVVDFGIRGFDLACALLDGYDLSILVDACPRGAAPGTLHLIEPDVIARDRAVASQASPADIDPHGLTPASVLRLASTMAGRLNRIVVVGCEPESLGGEDGRMGLSGRVEAAIDGAIELISSLVPRLLEEEHSA